MICTSDTSGRIDAVIELFTRTFARSEGIAEGRAIGSLVQGLFDSTPVEDLFPFLALQGEEVIGALFFTRLHSDAAPHRHITLMAPVAVEPAWQGRSVGRGLITHALWKMRGHGAEIAVTYGDPNFYTKIGFRPIDTSVLPSPLPLTRPEGWLGQPLGPVRLEKTPGPVRCVPAFFDAAYW